MAKSSAYVTTIVIDYATIVFIFYVYGVIFGEDARDGTKDFWPMFTSQIFILSAIWAREEVNFAVLGDSIAKCKREYSLSAKDYEYIGRSLVIGTLNLLINGISGKMYWTPVGFGMDFIYECYLPFLTIIVLKDVLCLVKLHKWMHEIPWLYKYHKEHHTVGKNAQSLMALHIDFLDLIAENMIAIIAYQGCQYAFGFPVRMHLGAFLLSSLLDVNIHSVNPYSMVFYCPPLDYIFRCNIAHQIHHAVQTENYTFIPYHHVFPGAVSKELAKYNKIMETDFVF